MELNIAFYLFSSLAVFYLDIALLQEEVCNATSRLNASSCENSGLCLNGQCRESEGICHCDPGWIGERCDFCCDLQCQTNEHCTISGTGEKKCVCTHTLKTGPDCEHPEEKNECKHPSRELWDQCTDTWCKNGYCEAPYEDYAHFQVCRCDEGWVGDRCDICCNMTCKNNGTCILESGTIQCDCYETGFHGSFCDIPIEEHTVATSPTATAQVKESLSKPAKSRFLALTSVLSVLLLAAVIIIGLIIRKRRSSFSKQISRFSKTGKNESLKYDVMIYFSSNHEASCQLVTRELIPALEDMELIVCSNQPALLPNTATEESIHQACENSRRIILLLSRQLIEDNANPDSQSSEASEMLEVLDVDRTVVVRMTSLDTDTSYFMGLSVTYILTSVVCIDYPQRQQATNKAYRDFWRKLKLCLPSKRAEISVAYLSV